MKMIGLVLMFACHHEATGVAPVHLEWRGVDGKLRYRDSVLRAMQSKRLVLAPCIDARKDKQLIGRFEEEGAGDARTRDDVSSFCSETLRDRTQELGVQWVDAAPDFTLRPELQKYFVVEGDRFRGTVKLRFTLVAKDGSEAWATTVEGKSSKWGGTHEAENYAEALNVAFNDATQQLLHNRDFEAALQGEPPPPPEVPVAPPPPLPKGPTLRLQWRGVDIKQPGGSEPTLTALRATTIQLAAMTDTRSEPRAIGRYDNDKGKVVYTPDNVASFYGNILTERLRTQGVKLVTSGAAFELAPELVELVVVEDSDFVAVARIRFTLTKNGKSVWSGIGEGKGKRWGKTHKSENLNEALSTAVDGALRQLLSNAELAAALRSS
jgi:hypothetical protein